MAEGLRPPGGRVPLGWMGPSVFTGSAFQNSTGNQFFPDFPFAGNFFVFRCSCDPMLEKAGCNPGCQFFSKTNTTPRFFGEIHVELRIVLMGGKGRGRLNFGSGYWGGWGPPPWFFGPPLGPQNTDRCFRAVTRGWQGGGGAGGARGGGDPRGPGTPGPKGGGGGGGGGGTWGHAPAPVFNSSRDWERGSNSGRGEPWRRRSKRAFFTGGGTGGVAFGILFFFPKFPGPAFCCAGPLGGRGDRLVDSGVRIFGGTFWAVFGGKKMGGAEVSSRARGNCLWKPFLGGREKKDGKRPRAQGIEDHMGKKSFPGFPGQIFFSPNVWGPGPRIKKGGGGGPLFFQKIQIRHKNFFGGLLFHPGGRVGHNFGNGMGNPFKGGIRWLGGRGGTFVSGAVGGEKRGAHATRWSQGGGRAPKNLGGGQLSTAGPGPGGLKPREGISVRLGGPKGGIYGGSGASTRLFSGIHRQNPGAPWGRLGTRQKKTGLKKFCPGQFFFAGPNFVGSRVIAGSFLAPRGGRGQVARGGPRPPKEKKTRGVLRIIPGAPKSTAEKGGKIASVSFSGRFLPHVYLGGNAATSKNVFPAVGIWSKGAKGAGGGRETGKIWSTGGKGGKAFSLPHFKPSRLFSRQARGPKLCKNTIPGALGAPNDSFCLFSFAHQV